jgi:phospholipid/cholesterol/gamma-HCH transport system ATP-binding protein
MRSDQSPDTSAVAIRVTNVHKSFGEHAVLRGIELTINRGQITTVIGGSGSGKTVLIKHMIGLIKPDEGSIEVDGENIVNMPEHDIIRVRRKFGMLFQHSALFDSMTVEENIAFPLYEHTDYNRAQVRDLVQEKLEMLHLTGEGEKWPAELSGGMRKRVALARAIMLNPEFLIYDEPTTGLDPVLCSQVDDMIVTTQEQLGITTIVISHDMASTFRIAHQVAMIFDGQILVSGTPESVVASNLQPVEQFITTSGVRLEAIRG